MSNVISAITVVRNPLRLSHIFRVTVQMLGSEDASRKSATIAPHFGVMWMIFHTLANHIVEAKSEGFREWGIFSAEILPR